MKVMNIKNIIISGIFYYTGNYLLGKESHIYSSSRKKERRKNDWGTAKE